MRFLLLLVFVAVCALAASWSHGTRNHPAHGRAWHVRDSALSERLGRRAALIASRLGEWATDWGLAADGGGLALAWRRFLTLERTWPLLALLASSGVLAGLAIRESSRVTLRFSSPTWNYVGKRLAAASLVLGVAAPLAPLDVPAWLPYLAFLACSGGITLYVSNLPVKL